MVSGRLVAASVRKDCVDRKGYLIWDRVKPAHYCGAPYHNMFVAAYKTLAVATPYEGPELAKFEAHRRAMFEDI